MDPEYRFLVSGIVPKNETNGALVVIEKHFANLDDALDFVRDYFVSHMEGGQRARAM
jgi:hypothetical protein